MLISIRYNDEIEPHLTIDVPGEEVLIGSGVECDIVMADDQVFRQHARIVRCSNHYFLVVHREENGDIEPVIRETVNEHGHHFHWGHERRIDHNWFEVGTFHVRVGLPD